ncbi:restriction endonuclease subunit S [Limosilactobacillus reuteri]|uniref:restriction endonuclease subunit S n=1 Tax=Limosilactobacillus reuteri TaxID=1598 RepID=UPI001CDAC67C|nr:restriction endonuclease subunit S [Limosilactobacillus reuteri]MCC4331721.1 restriction endonuclease subunit S [Limosilactobacillus reuteri]
MNKGWEQRKLGKVACINPKTNIPDNFKYVDLESVVGTSLIKAKLTTKQLAPSRAQRVAKKGDIFYQTVRPYQKNNFLFDINNYDFQYVFSTGYAQLRSEINNYFLFSYLQRQRFVNLILRRSTGTSYPAISSKDLSEIKIIFPRNSKEQENIGKIINLIDALITLQQRKLEILIKLKQSFLTKIMANNIDKNPELYFNSASIKWLKQELSNLTIKEFKGNTKLNDTKTGKTEYLDAERLNGNVPLFIDKPINTLKSDILILWDGSKAGSVYYGFEGSLGSTLKAIRLNPKLVNSFFVYQQLKSKQDVIFNKYRTPNIPHVIKNFTKVYPIYFPSMAVQNKIARFLGNLDTLIEIQQKSIKDHKVIKKYLLQKLFI